MANITIKLAITEHKNFRGRKTGKVSCRVGEHQIFADSREDLDLQVQAFISRAAQPPEVALVRVDGEQRILTGSVHGVEVHREHLDGAGDGLVLLRSVSLSPAETDILDAAHDEISHLAQCAWKHGDPVPDFITEGPRKRAFQRWIRFQEAYKLAINSGKSESEAHQLACDATAA